MLENFYVYVFVIGTFCCSGELIRHVIYHQSGTIKRTGNELLAHHDHSGSFTEEWQLEGARLVRIDMIMFKFPPCTTDVRFLVTNNYTRPAIKQSYCGYKKVPKSELHIGKGSVLTLNGSMRFIKPQFELHFSINPVCDPCGRSLTLKSGEEKVIKSPAFPLSYGASCSCTWQALVDDSNNILKVAFRKFHLQDRDSTGNCGDSLSVYDGTTTKSKSLGQFCGNQIPDTIETSSNVVTLHFFSDIRSGSDVHMFYIVISANKKEDELAGLQSVAAILGAISFGIFIGLLLCSVLYKRWSREHNDTCNLDNADPENDYDDVIQLAAPPSYRKVMAAPDQYPTTPNASPDVSRSNKLLNIVVDIPDTEPPQYPGTDDELPSQYPGLDDKTTDKISLPPLPQYDIVSESEDDWFPIKRKTLTPKMNLIGNNGRPPTYEAVTSEGSDMEVVHCRENKKGHTKLRSRTSRSSVSKIYQARAHSSDSNSDDEDTNSCRPRLKSSSSKLAAIEDDVSDVGIVMVPHIAVHPVNSNEPGSSARASTPPPTITPASSAPVHLHGYSSERTTDRVTPDSDRDVGRSRSYNDLARHAIHNSIGKTVIKNNSPILRNNAIRRSDRHGNRTSNASLSSQLCDERLVDTYIELEELPRVDNMESTNTNRENGIDNAQTVDT